MPHSAERVSNLSQPELYLLLEKVTLLMIFSNEKREELHSSFLINKDTHHSGLCMEEAVYDTAKY